MESKEVKEKGKTNEQVEKNQNKQTSKKFQRYKQGEIVY
jgi:hypothetical protein